MRRALLLLLLTVLMLPAAALADKTITLTFTGDVTLGSEDYLRGDPDAFPAYYEKYGPEYFLGNMAEFFAGDDLTVVNLEGVLTDRENLPRRDKGHGLKWGSSYWFRGPTEYVKVLTSASVEVATLANNHSFDYGDKGLEDTIAALDAAGIQWLNTYNKNRNADKEKFLFYEKDGVRICLFTIYWDDYRQGDPTGNGAWLAEEIRAIDQSGEVDAIIGILHGGQEYGRHRTNPQTIFTRMCMNAGVDLVICHHAHVVMGMDVINNRCAFYSLGNFCFGGNRNAYQVRNGGKKIQDAAPALIVRAELTFEDDGTYKGQQMTLYPVQTSSVDRARNARSQINNYNPKFITGPLAAHVLHLMQVDMNYDLKDAVNKEWKALVVAKEKELDAMTSSEGMSSLTLPFLPAVPPAP